jgi:hypothetical protein
MQAKRLRGCLLDLSNLITGSQIICQLLKAPVATLQSMAHTVSTACTVYSPWYIQYSLHIQYMHTTVYTAQFGTQLGESVRSITHIFKLRLLYNQLLYTVRSSLNIIDAANINIGVAEAWLHAHLDCRSLSFAALPW